jgi:hypothetical protein
VHPVRAGESANSSQAVVAGGMKRLRLVLARVESVSPDGSAVLKPLDDVKSYESGRRDLAEIMREVINPRADDGEWMKREIRRVLGSPLRARREE